VTADEFRSLALSLPETSEQSHMDHPDFRVAGKIFATLGYPDGGWGMVKLTAAQQSEIVRDIPEMFRPVKGGWGERGATNVRLAHATEDAVRRALVAAWKNTAPKRLVRQLDEQ
jgi:hypothetical protein